MAELPQLAGPVLTAYLDTNPANARNQGGHGAATWLRSHARELAAGLTEPERAACLEQVARVTGEFELLRAGARSVVVFSGPNAWQWWTLQVTVEDEVAWGAPALGQLLWLLDEHQPCGVVVVSRGGARFFRYHMGEIEEDPAHPFTLDTSQWRQHNLMTGMGREREGFRSRQMSHEQRFYHDIATACVSWSQQERLNPVVLAGSSRAVEQVYDAMPEELKAVVAAAGVLEARASQSEILKVVEPAIESWKRRQEEEDVERLLGAREARVSAHLVVSGVKATLAALDQGELRKLVAVRQLPEPLRATVPQLAQARGVEVEVVAGRAEERLNDDAEGMAGWRHAA